MRQGRAVVVGAGVGGIAAALELAAAGLEVTVVEAAARSGGKIRQSVAEGRGIDVGPTVFTMRWVFEDLAASAGLDFNAFVKLTPLSVLARHAWGGLANLDLFADFERTCDAIAALCGPDEALGYRAFCAESARVFKTLRHTFLTAERTTPMGLSWRAGPAGFLDILALRPFETLAGRLGRLFKDQRLRQLFGRYATYCGSSPFAAPATLMLIAHVEREGVWSVDGGMQALADGLEAMGRAAGASFRFESPVAEIMVRGGETTGVRLTSGEEIPADWVIANVDTAALGEGRLGADVARAARPRPFVRRSLSAVTFAGVVKTKGFPLSRHNVFFAEDWRSEFDDLFEKRRLPQDPTVYVCAQDRGGGGLDPSGPERIFMLINAPARGDEPFIDERELARCRTLALDQLKRSGLTLGDGSLTATTPQDFHHRFPGSAGALYGPAMHGWAAAFQRPTARTKIGGLYLAGGGVHPGAGVPMAALSGRLAAARLLSDRVSTRRFRRAVMLGGTLTPKAPMDALASP